MKLKDDPGNVAARARYAASAEVRADRARRSRAWKAANPERNKELGKHHRALRSARGGAHRQPEHLKRRYNLTPEDVASLLLQQGGCAICGTTEPCKSGKVSWHVDHDHACCPGDRNARTCGKCIRGILCPKCNLSLGGFKDDPALLQRAIDYLTRRLG